jgi:hypothetical protein
MAYNKTDFEIKLYQKAVKITRAELAEKMAMSIPTFITKIRTDSFTDFEKQQLRELGIKNI